MSNNYPQYFISSNDEFNAIDFPKVVKEIDKICMGTSEMPIDYKAEILISFARSHIIHGEWLKTNPNFVELVTSGALPMKNIESLFQACEKNQFFRNQLELYLKSSFK
jgi:hypothetical protein